MLKSSLVLFCLVSVYKNVISQGSPSHCYNLFNHYTQNSPKHMATSNVSLYVDSFVMYDFL
jgi:hypothetical protein